ncbi:MAG: DUF692 domain-containing protein [Limibacillus sp.]|jgi:uncharacterized protein (UPF0276 family)
MVSSAHTVQGTPPKKTGVSFKAEHFQAIRSETPAAGWFEVHAENYMGAGGPPHAQLEAIRRDYPLSLHGVGLSLGGTDPLDREHMLRFKALCERYQPWMVSEHLAWTRHGGEFFNDLLPLPYTEETLDRVAGRIQQFQDVLGRQVLIENPSLYIGFEDSALEETAFLRALAKRSGCGLLLDLNNLVVSATNRGYEAADYLSAFPLPLVGEIHLAGHASETLPSGRPLLIDAHDRPAGNAVWSLFAALRAEGHEAPALVEWDNDLPDWPVLLAEAQKADRIAEEAKAQREGASLHA